MTGISPRTPCFLGFFASYVKLLLATCLEDLQGESLAGLAVGRVGEGLAGEVGDVLTGDVAADDLEQEEVDGDHGIELALAVVVSGLLTGLLDGLRPKEVGNVLSELLEDDRDPALHRETSWSAGV